MSESIRFIHPISIEPITNQHFYHFTLFLIWNNLKLLENSYTDTNNEK